MLTQQIDKIKHKDDMTVVACQSLKDKLGLKNYPKRMECYDISNISGFENVGSMVVYEKGKPKRSDYRKFKIKGVQGPDDYACMEEVLKRRFTHGIQEQQKDELGGFAKFPDLILMDGGKGQVNVALRVLDKLRLNIPVCGMVKDDNHRTRGLYFNNVEIPIDRYSVGFKLITRIQDEAHRFAITYHRSLRGKRSLASVLDDIPGVGEKRKKNLLKHFGSFAKVKEASVEELMQVEGIHAAVAEEIYHYLRTHQDLQARLDAHKK